MAITIELFEDTGAVISGRGTPHQTWEFDLGPNATTNDFAARGTLTRPASPGTYTYTYERYIYAKVSCSSASDYKKIKKVEWLIENNITADNFVTFMYKRTNVYSPPVNTDDGTKNMLPTGVGLMRSVVANVSTSGPNNATSFTSPTDGTTFYTDYLVIQMRAEYPTTGYTAPAELPITLILHEVMKD